MDTFINRRRRKKENGKKREEVAMTLGIKTFIITALLAITIKRYGAFEAIRVIIRYVIWKCNLVGILASLNGSVAVFDIMNPHLKKVILLEIQRG